MSVIWCQNFIRPTRNNLHLQAFNGLCHRGKEALPLSPENIEGHTLAASVKHMASWQGKLQLLPKLFLWWFNSSCIFPTDFLSYDILVPYFQKFLGNDIGLNRNALSFLHPSTPSTSIGTHVGSKWRSISWRFKRSSPSASKVWKINPMASRRSWLACGGGTERLVGGLFFLGGGGVPRDGGEVVPSCSKLFYGSFHTLNA